MNDALRDCARQEGAIRQTGGGGVHEKQGRDLDLPLACHGLQTGEVTSGKEGGMRIGNEGLHSDVGSAQGTSSLPNQIRWGCHAETASAEAGGVEAGNWISTILTRQEQTRAEGGLW